MVLKIKHVSAAHPQILFADDTTCNLPGFNTLPIPTYCLLDRMTYIWFLGKRETLVRNKAVGVWQVMPKLLWRSRGRGA